MTPEKINFDDLRTKSNMFGEILFIRALMKKQKELGIDDITQVLPGHQGNTQGTMEVVLTVNGVQLPFIEVLNALRSALGDLDREQVEEWVNAKMSSLSETIYEAEQVLKRGLIATLKEKFPNS